MKDQRFAFWIISENDGRQRSFNISRRSLYGILFFAIIFCGFSVYGLYQTLNEDSLVSDRRELKIFKSRAISILNDLNATDLIDDTEMENSLKAFFENNGYLVPVNPPVVGVVTKGIERENGKLIHSGIDIAAEYGASVKSPLQGMVVYSGPSSDLGNMVIMAHDYGLYTLYGHNKQNLVKKQEYVTVGQEIAKVGGTGESNGPHLHFEIWEKDRVLDPREFIEIYKKRDVSIK